MKKFGLVLVMDRGNFGWTGHKFIKLFQSMSKIYFVIWEVDQLI